MRKVTLALLFVFFMAQIAFATEKQMTITGRISAGTMMSNIVTSDGISFSFASDSKVGTRIFKACKVDDLCKLTGMVEDEEIIQSITEAKKIVQAYLTIPAIRERNDNNIKERKKVEQKGVVQLLHNPAGRYFGLGVGKGKNYTLVYVWDLDDKTSEMLTSLVESKKKVTVKGTIRVWTDGNISFDDSEPVEIYK